MEYERAACSACSYSHTLEYRLPAQSIVLVILWSTSQLTAQKCSSSHTVEYRLPAQPVVIVILWSTSRQAACSSSHTVEYERAVCSACSCIKTVECS